jgi:hypothetical protein
VSDDFGRGALAQRAHPDDPDQRCVVLRWDVVSYALMGPPNDEARNRHRLYEAGLKDVDWLGVVRDSSLVADLRPMLGQGAVFVPVSPGTRSGRSRSVVVPSPSEPSPLRPQAHTVPSDFSAST